MFFVNPGCTHKINAENKFQFYLCLLTAGVGSTIAAPYKLTNEPLSAYTVIILDALSEAAHARIWAVSN